MGVTFEDMVRKSMRMYWLKTDEYDSMNSNKNRKYNKKYFDSVENDMVPKGQKLTKPSIPKMEPGMSVNLSAKPPSGPIPGENYTSDTKNYPWHRPPEITDFDTAIEVSTKQLMSEEGSSGLVTMLQAGMDIGTLTDTFVTSGIGSGKWTPDFAILLAGPVSHIIQLMAKGYGIDADLGIDLPKPKHTISYVKALQEDNDRVNEVYKALNDPAVVAHMEQSIKGLMGAAQQMGQPQQIDAQQDAGQAPEAVSDGDVQ